MNDAQAIQAYARSGDPEAFRELVDRYARFVLATCQRYLRDAADAEDAAQETFVKLARSAGEIRSNVAAWLHRAATTTCFDMIRMQARRRKHERAAARSDVVEGPKLMSAVELAEQVDEALASLDDADRDLLIRRFLLGRTQASLAVEQGVSEATLSRRVSGALEAMRAALAQRGVSTTVAGLSAGLAGLGTSSAEAAVPAAFTTALTKVGMSGVGTGAGVAGAHVAGFLAVAAILVTLVGGVVVKQLYLAQRAVAPAAPPPLPVRGWNPATPLPLTLDGWWRVPGGEPGRDFLIVVDAFRSEVTIVQAGGGPGPGHVTYRMLADGATAQVIDNRIDPQSNGQRVPLRLLLLPEDRLIVRTRSLSVNSDSELSVVAERVGPATVFRPTGRAPSNRPRLGVGTDEIFFENASFDLILSLTINDFDNPHRSDVRVRAPAGQGYDVDIQTSDGAISARQILRRAQLRELGIQVRQESRMQDVYLLQVPPGGDVQLQPMPKDDPQSGFIDVVADERVWFGHTLQWLGEYIEYELDRAVVDNTGRGDARYRYAEPWPGPRDHDRVAHFLEAAGLTLVEGRRAIEVTVVESADLQSVPPIDHGTYAYFPPRTPNDATLHERVASLAPSSMPVEALAALQGRWRLREGDPGPDLHIIGNVLVMTVPPPARPGLDDWPAELRAIVAPPAQSQSDPWIDDVARITSLEPYGEGQLLTLRWDGRLFHLLLRIDGDTMTAAAARDEASPKVETFDDPDIEIATYQRAGPSPLRDRLNVTP